MATTWTTWKHPTPCTAFPADEDVAPPSALWRAAALVTAVLLLAIAGYIALAYLLTMGMVAVVVLLCAGAAWLITDMRSLRRSRPTPGEGPPPRRHPSPGR